MKHPRWAGRAWWSAPVAAIFAVGLLYYWEARAAGSKFYWHYDLDGFYDDLGRALVSGHVDMPIQPSPKLLAAADPNDPAIDDSLKVQDLAFYRGRYYLYHGVGPAILLFAPWRLISRHDLPENFALFLLCIGGFAFSCGAVWQTLALARARPEPWLATLLVLALGVCCGAPFLLNRAAMYELAICGGYFGLSAALFFLARGLRPGSAPAWLGGAGLMFGFATACRPQLGIAAIVALAGLVLVRRPRREWLAVAAPFAFACALIGAYNFARFGSPFEFGFQYQLNRPGQHNLGFSFVNLPLGLYYLLGCAPDFGSVFPWIRMVFRNPFNSPSYPFPPLFFIEPTVGALWAAPMLVFGMFPPRKVATEARLLLRIAAVASLGILLFQAFTHLESHRYEMDFVGIGLIAACACAGVRIMGAAGWRRSATASAFGAATLFGVVVNLALGVAGPYNDILKHRPARYFTIASWFSPTAESRPLYNPAIDASFTARFAHQANRFRDPLLTIGQQTWSDFIYAEHRDGALLLISEGDASQASAALPVLEGAAVPMEIAYSPVTGDLTVTAQGSVILTHKVGPLAAAPVQVTLGENRVDSQISAPEFTGVMEARQLLVRDAGAKAPREVN